MKKIIPMLFLLVSCGTKPVIIDPVTKSFNVEGSKSELYVMANTWFVDTFDSAKMVIQFSDKEEGVITGKYMMAPKWAYNGYAVVQNGGYNAVIQIQVKDNASKITVKPESFPTNSKFTAPEAMTKIRDVINDYIKYMNNNSLEDF